MASGLHIALPEPAANQRRQRRTLALLGNSRIRVNGHSYLNFSSNDYLGLSQHPTLLAAFRDTAALYGCSSSASPLVTGYQAPHAQLVEQLGDWLKRDDVLLFSSGFAANTGVLKQIAAFYNKVLLDKLSHASLIDGVRDALGGPSVKGHSVNRLWQRFRHQDQAQLAQLLNKPASSPALVVTEGVFSMDGDTTAVADMAALCSGAKADLMVDDAHAIGVCGEHGEGIAGACSQQQVPIVTATFGKALGVGGAFVAGSTELTNYLVQNCREYIYSTAFSAAQASAVNAAIQICRSDEGAERRHQLQQNIHRFRTGAGNAELDLLPSATAIQGIICGADDSALAASRYLADAGIWCSAIRPPTVQNGSARLRITITADHTTAQLGQLVTALATLKQQRFWPVNGVIA
ncbi:MAG: 8-amino-7-oxononanoate synthase [Idiomarina sp.]